MNEEPEISRSRSTQEPSSDPRPLSDLPAGSGYERMVGAAGSVSAAILVSRILGVVREMVLARYFGAGFFTDAFNIAYRIPNLLRDLFAEGALSSAFVPIFIRQINRKGKSEAWLLANNVINVLVVLLGGVTLVFFFGARFFVYLLAAGYADVPEKFDLTVQMTRIMSPFLLWIALASVAMAMLNACGSFFIPALASSAFNVCCILSGIFLSPVMPRWGMAPVVSMAIGAVAGGASQLLFQVPLAHKLGYRHRFVFDLADPGVRRIAKLMLPAMIGLSATQINIMVDSQLASRFGNGPVSWLNYAFRLMQLPIGLFGVAIATVTLAAVSRHAAQDSLPKVRDTVLSSLRLAACLTFPATVGLIVFRVEIVRLLYQRGFFLANDTEKTSEVVLFYALALFAYAAVKILAPTFYALGDSRTPVRTSMITVAAKVILSFLLVIPFGFLGLAISTAAASWINFGLLLKSLSVRVGIRWNRREPAAYLKITMASLAIGLLSSVTFRLMQHIVPGQGTAELAVTLGIPILAGAAAMLPMLQMFGVAEAAYVLSILRRGIFEG